MTKKQALEFAKARLSQSFSEVKNCGKIFICRDSYGSVLRNVIYSIYEETGLAVEVFMFGDYGYVCFVGTKEHAKALQEAFGGTLEKSDTSYFASTPEYEAWMLGVELSEFPSNQDVWDILI